MIVSCRLFIYCVVCCLLKLLCDFHHQKPIKKKNKKTTRNDGPVGVGSTNLGVGQIWTALSKLGVDPTNVGSCFRANCSLDSGSRKSGPVRPNSRMLRPDLGGVVKRVPVSTEGGLASTESGLGSVPVGLISTKMSGIKSVFRGKCWLRLLRAPEPAREQCPKMSLNTACPSNKYRIRQNCRLSSCQARWFPEGNQLK